jgi:hypothetical protein
MAPPIVSEMPSLGAIARAQNGLPAPNLGYLDTVRTASQSGYSRGVVGQEFIINDNQHKETGFGTIACDFGQSLFHSAVESPVNGVTQLVNEVTGTNIKPLTIVGAPAAPTSTADSYAQKIGGAIGMVVPYFLVSKGVGRVVDGFAGTSMAKGLSMTPFLESSVTRAGLSGAVYGGVFNPVSPDEKNPAWARLRNAAVDGATFATLTGTSESLAKLGIFKPATSALANTFKSIGTTMIAGVPAGIVSAEGHSVLSQGRFATGSELKQSAIDFATIGGALAALTHGVSATQGAWGSYRAAGAEPLSSGSAQLVNFKPDNAGEIRSFATAGGEPAARQVAENGTETFERTGAQTPRIDGGELRPVMEYQVRPGQTDVAATAEAVNQSNSYKESGQVRGKLQEGFQSVSGETRVGPDGNWTDPNRPGIVYDRAGDAVLRDTIAEAHAKFDQFRNDPKKLAEELAAFSNEKMEPAGWTSKHVDDADAMFRSQNGNKRILLGDYIQRAALGEGAGACQPQAMLMKILGDNFGLDITMSVGYLGKVPAGGLPSGFSPNHAFTELHLNGENLVYDPRNNILGTHIDQLANLTPAREFGTGEAAIAKPEQFNLKRGDVVAHDDMQWRLSDEKPSSSGDLVLRRDGITSITSDQLAQFNPGRTAKIGEDYEIPLGSGGQKDGGWTVQGTNADGTIRLSKVDGVKLEVSPNELASENPQIARALGRDNQVLRSSPNELSIVKRQLDSIENKLRSSELSPADRIKFMDSVKAELKASDPRQYQALAKKLDALPHLDQIAPALKQLLELRATNPGINLDFALRGDIHPADVQRYSQLASLVDKVSDLPPDFKSDMLRVLRDRLDIYNIKSTAAPAEIVAMRIQTDNVTDAFRGFRGNKSIGPSVGKNVIKLLDMGADGDIRIAFSQIMAAGADSSAVKLYTDVTRHSLQIDMPASQKGGHIDEFRASKQVRDLAANGRLGDGWVFVPSANASLADSAGVDGAFINVKTKTWVPVDFAKDANTVDGKVRDGKGDWALAVNKPYGGGAYTNAELKTSLTSFLGEGSRAPKLDLTTLERPYGSGSMPFPSFRRVLTSAEADSLTADEGRQVLTTPNEINRFEQQIGRNVNELGEPERSFYNQLRHRAHSSFTPRRIETEFAQDVLPSMAAAVDVRVNPEAPNMIPVEMTIGHTKYGDSYVEFPRNVPNSNIKAVRVYNDGHLVGIEPVDPNQPYSVEREVTLGSLKSNMGKATSLYAESDPRALRKLGSTPSQFNFSGKTNEQIFSQYPSIRVLGDAIENGGIVRAAATDSVALGRAKLDLDFEARTDITLSDLTELQKMDLAKETLQLRVELKQPDLSPSKARSLLEVKRNLPEDATWGDVIAAERSVRELGMDASEAPQGLVVSKLRSLAPSMDPQTAKELAIWTAEFPIAEEYMPALAKMYASKPASKVLDDFDRVHEFFQYAQSQGMKLSPDLAMAKFKEVEKYREWGYNGGDVSIIASEVLGVA